MIGWDKRNLHCKKKREACSRFPSSFHFFFLLPILKMGKKYICKYLIYLLEIVSGTRLLGIKKEKENWQDGPVGDVGLFL